jgi:hypothetical protein
MPVSPNEYLVSGQWWKVLLVSLTSMFGEQAGYRRTTR